MPKYTLWKVDEIISKSNIILMEKTGSTKKQLDNQED